ncbi:uncharacterized protein [Haliotis cracherodii]|uniref:uncharacterized protein n=1 Tax=Haliotis cracherodii TaxID=6455 RepID=UPI0039EB1F05
MGLLSVEVFFLLSGSLVHCDNCFNEYSAIQYNRYMEHQMFRKVATDALYSCAAECLMSSACLSFSYELESRTCFLNSNSSDLVDVVHRQGFVFSNIEGWPKYLVGGCTKASFPATSRCEANRLGVATSMPEFRGCGDPPEVTAARAEYDGHYVGAVTRYTCTGNFKQCNDDTTSVCQATGLWSSVTGSCAQNRWRTLMSGFNGVFLCGSSDKFKLQINLTPTVTDRASIYLRNGANVLWMVEFRFLCLIDIWYHKQTVFNAQINDQWGDQITVPWLHLIAGQMSEVVMSLDSGVYMLVVDGFSFDAFPERLPGIQPDTLQITDNLSITSIDITVN